MARAKPTDVYSVVEETNEPIEIEAPLVYNEPEQTVRVQSRFPATLKYTGLSTGKLYVWEKSGSVVNVDAADAPALLEKVLGSGACCGGGNRNKLFELV